MQFTPILPFLVLVVASVLAAPTSIERRAANLKISLRETGKNKVRWHFGLVIHAPGGITGAAVKIHEHVVKNGCLAYDTEIETRPTGVGQLPVTGTLIAAKGEADDAALDAAVVEIIKTVPGSKPASSTDGFNNCFDFAVEAVRRLSTARYVSQADYQGFQNYHDTHAATVRAKTDAHTIALCTRANGKPCRSAGKTASKAPAPAKKISSKASVPAKAASKTGKK